MEIDVATTSQHTEWSCAFLRCLFLAFTIQWFIFLCLIWFIFLCLIWSNADSVHLTICWKPKETGLKLEKMMIYGWSWETCLLSSRVCAECTRCMALTKWVNVFLYFKKQSWWAPDILLFKSETLKNFLLKKWSTGKVRPHKKDWKTDLDHCYIPE